MRHVHDHAVRGSGQRSSWRDEAGEGVISTAIAVLIMALLGAGMWLAFQTIFNDATDRAGDSIRIIGG